MKILVGLVGLSTLLGCAQPENHVLEPYVLADGRVYQDVVSVGANGNGTAPTITTLNTYALGVMSKSSDGKKTVLKPYRTSSNNNLPIVSTSATESSPWFIFLAGASAGAATGLTSNIGSGSDTVINNDNNNDNNNSSAIDISMEQQQ